MYWSEQYSSPQAAQRDLAMHARGRKRLTPTQHAIAMTAARSNLGDIGSISSFFKKVVKTANKLDPLYSARKKIDPVTKAVNKAVGIKTSSAPKSAPSVAAEVPGTSVVPATATVPIQQLQPDFSFGAGGGGGGSPAIAAPADAGTDTGIPMWVWVAGAGAVLVLFLALRKR